MEWDYTVCFAKASWGFWVTILCKRCHGSFGMSYSIWLMSYGIYRDDMASAIMMSSWGSKAYKRLAHSVPLWPFSLVGKLLLNTHLSIPSAIRFPNWHLTAIYLQNICVIVSCSLRIICSQCCYIFNEPAVVICCAVRQHSSVLSWYNPTFGRGIRIRIPRTANSRWRVRINHGTHDAKYFVRCDIYLQFLQSKLRVITHNWILQELEWKRNKSCVRQGRCLLTWIKFNPQNDQIDPEFLPIVSLVQNMPYFPHTFHRSWCSGTIWWKEDVKTIKPVLFWEQRHKNLSSDGHEVSFPQKHFTVVSCNWH